MAYKLLEKDVERSLVEQMRNGSESARQSLILAYRPLVEAKARKYAGLYGIMNHLEDLEAEFWAVLCASITKYDPNRNASIAYYMEMHLKNTLADYMARMRYASKVPADVVKGTFKTQRVRKHLRRRGIPETIENIASYFKRPRVRVETFCSLEHHRAVDLDAPVSSTGEGTMTWLDTLIEDKPSALEDIINGERKQHLREALRVLSSRELIIVKARFGLNGNEKEHTLGALGTRLNLSKERVRQIEMKAIQKVRDEMKRLTQPPPEQMARELEFA